MKEGGIRSGAFPDAGTTNICRALSRYSDDVAHLRLWAKDEANLSVLLQATRLITKGQDALAQNDYVAAESYFDQSILLQVFPFLDDDLMQTKWHTSLFNPTHGLMSTRRVLSDAFILLSASCFETANQQSDLRLFMKSHFALDTAVEISLLDDKDISTNEYTNLLHLNILHSIDEFLPKVSSSELRDIVEEAGIPCTNCENDLEYQRHLFQALETGLIYGVSDEVRLEEIRKCGRNQYLQQASEVIAHQISRYLSSPVLSTQARDKLKAMGLECQSRKGAKKDGACMSFFSKDVVHSVLCADLDPSSPHYSPDDSQGIWNKGADESESESESISAKSGRMKLSSLPKLNPREQGIQKILFQKFSNIFFDSPLEATGLTKDDVNSCDNPAQGEGNGGFGDDLYNGWNPYPPHQQAHFKEWVRTGPLNPNGMPTEAELSYYYAKGMSELQDKMDKTASDPHFLSKEEKGDDPIVPITLFFLLIFYFGSWMTWKNRKALMRRLQRYDIWNRELRKRENSEDTVALKLAMTSCDIGKLERALSEVSYADPAVLRRARHLLAQRKKAKKADDAAKSKAKAAKLRASALKKGKEEKSKKIMMAAGRESTALTVAAVRAKVESERNIQLGSQTDSPRSERSNTFDSSVSEEDFMPVGGQQGSRRKRATTTGSLSTKSSVSGESERDLKDKAILTRKNSDTSASHSSAKAQQEVNPGNVIGSALPPVITTIGVANAPRAEKPKNQRRNSGKNAHNNHNGDRHHHHGHGYVKRGKSFDKGYGSGPSASKGRDAYVSFRKGSREKNEDRKHDATKHRTSNSNGAGHGHGHGQERGERRYSNRRNFYSAPTSTGGAGSSLPDYRSYPVGNGNGSYMFSKNELLQGQQPASNFGSNYSASQLNQRSTRINPIPPVSSSNYGSSLYQTDLIGSLVGSYSPFKANGNGGAIGSNLKAMPPAPVQQQQHHSRIDTSPNLSQAQWTSNPASANWIPAPTSDASSQMRSHNQSAAASIPKHMRANSFPEVDAFDVYTNPSKNLAPEDTVEWLPTHLIDSLSKE